MYRCPKKIRRLKEVQGYWAVKWGRKEQIIILVHTVCAASSTKNGEFTLLC